MAYGLVSVMRKAVKAGVGTEAFESHLNVIELTSEAFFKEISK